jgi:hypothetical protein
MSATDDSPIAASDSSTQPPAALSLEAALGLLDQATDPLWLAQAALFISSSPDAQLGNVAVALARAWEATTGFEEAARAATSTASSADSAGENGLSVERREALAARLEIGERRRRLRTWIELLGGEAALKRAEEDKRKAAKESAVAAGETEPELDLVDDDPWAELEESSDDDNDKAPSAGGRVASRAGTHKSTASISGGGGPRSALPFDLPTFLAAPLPYLALHLTTPPQLRSLAVFVGRHRDALAPFRFTLLESIPDWVQPELFRALLPQCDDEMEHELPWATELIKADDDGDDEMAWLESAEAHQLLGTAPNEAPADLPTESALLSAEELTAWYRWRIESIEATSGLVDRALAFLQHAVSRNVPDLDSLGEDLSLLSKLVYDARSQASSSAAVVAAADVSEWTLARWRAATPEEVTAGYLRYATPTTVVPIIRSLLLPYLFVLLSRSERTDTPDPTIPARLIQAWLLTAPLDLAVEVFAASKATLPEHERILKRDEEVAREALAILYGSQRTDRWDVMSRIFECMPAWTFGPEDHEDGEGSMTLLALSQFLRPTAAAPAPSPTDLHTFFLPLRAPALSILLDTLDLHLDAAETFARWGVPATLGWFILSAEDRAEQLSWATRLARRGGERAEANEAAKGRRVGKGKAAEGWDALLRDMKKLRGDGDGALGRLSEVEVVKIFFGGLLSSGSESRPTCLALGSQLGADICFVTSVSSDFAVAKTMLNARPAPRDRSSIEDLVLAASREFYDNAETGNLHSGEMKQAYSWCVPPPDGSLMMLVVADRPHRFTIASRSSHLRRRPSRRSKHSSRRRRASRPTTSRRARPPLRRFRRSRSGSRKIGSRSSRVFCRRRTTRTSTPKSSSSSSTSSATGATRRPSARRSACWPTPPCRKATGSAASATSSEWLRPSKRSAARSGRATQSSSRR